MSYCLQFIMFYFLLIYFVCSVDRAIHLFVMKISVYVGIKSRVTWLHSCVPHSTLKVFNLFHMNLPNMLFSRNLTLQWMRVYCTLCDL